MYYFTFHSFISYREIILQKLLRLTTFLISLWNLFHYFSYTGYLFTLDKNMLLSRENFECNLNPSSKKNIFIRKKVSTLLRKITTLWGKIHIYISSHLDKYHNICLLFQTKYYVNGNNIREK